MADYESERLAELIGPVARQLLGEPNKDASTKTELRYGQRGSLSVNLVKGTWFDHEANEGGGVLDLVQRETKLTEGRRLEWLEQQGHLTKSHLNNGAAKNGAGGHSHFTILQTYDYCDETENLLFQVCRLDPKDFRQRKRDPKGRDGWSWSVRGVRNVPYRLPELIEAIANGQFVCIVEGEKDADNLWKIGVPATTNAGGAGKWRDELTEYFRDADVVVIEDHDPQKRHPKTKEPMFHEDGRPILPGQDHARAVAAALDGTAKRVRLLKLKDHWPQMPPKGDVSDWLAASHTREELDELIEHTPTWAPGQDTPAVVINKKPKVYSKAEFLSLLTLPDFLVDGVLQRRFIYALTGQTGHAKTAVALLIAQLVSSQDRNATLGNRRVAKGRVIYFVGENPDDVRYRLVGSDAQRSDHPEADNISFIPGIFDIAGVMDTIRADCEINGEVAMIVVDTSAAYFLGNEELSNTQMGAYARTLRLLTTLPGGPCVLVLCHPIKHVTEPSQLLPRGGGAYLAEMDGNLTLWRLSDDVVELHHTKIRGPGFQGLSFQLETITSTKLMDKSGRPFSTVRATFISQTEEDKRLNQAEHDEDRVLAAMLAKPHEHGGSFAAWAQDLGWVNAQGEPYKKKVERIITKLSAAKPKLTSKSRDKWALTEQGKEAARKVAIRLVAEQAARSQQDLDL
jgi:hypothetical protein